MGEAEAKGYAGRRFEGSTNYSKTREKRKNYLGRKKHRETIERAREKSYGVGTFARLPDKEKSDWRKFAAADTKFERGKGKNLDRQVAEETLRVKGDLAKIARKIPIFILFVIGGIALAIGSMRITGNVISGLTGTAPGLLGVVLFIAGLVGLFSHRRK